MTLSYIFDAYDYLKKVTFCYTYYLHELEYFPTGLSRAAEVLRAEYEPVDQVACDPARSTAANRLARRAAVRPRARRHRRYGTASGWENIPFVKKLCVRKVTFFRYTVGVHFRYCR